MVYFVGAGSGAADLITVRGMHMLQQADVIIYAGEPGAVTICQNRL